MERVELEARPKYIVDEKGKKKGVLLSLKDYQRIAEAVEDLEDTIDLLRAEREAISFTPYEKFRKKWLSL
jgi:hypothetical protein